MAYLEKWKSVFPETVGGISRPIEAIANNLDFNSDGFPQFISTDPVRYDLQNTFLNQLFSNDEYLRLKLVESGKIIDSHEIDPAAHAAGIAGNAYSASQLKRIDLGNLSGITLGAFKQKLIDCISQCENGNQLLISGKFDIGGLAMIWNAGNDLATLGSGSIVNMNLMVNYLNTHARIELCTYGNDSHYEIVRTSGIWSKCRRYVLFTPDANNNVIINGNATSADKLSTARTISLTGKATGSATFDGSGNAAITVNSVTADTCTGNSFTATTAEFGKSLSIVSGNEIKFDSSGYTNGGIVYVGWYDTQKSTKRINKWVFKNLGGKEADVQAKTFYSSGGGFYGDTHGNADTATKLKTARKITITGAVSGSATFDGSGDITINVT